MGACYYLFLEGKKNGKWVCLNPFYKEEGKSLLSPLFVSSSRTYFEKTYYELLHLSSSYGKSSPVSKEVKEWLYEDLDCSEEEKEKYVNEMATSAIFIPYSQILRRVKTKTECFDHTALIHKNDYANLINGIEEEPSDVITDLDWYKELPKQAQDLYVLYSWDDSDDWRSHFKKIVKYADFILVQYCNCFFTESVEFEEFRIVMFMFD